VRQREGKWKWDEMKGETEEKRRKSNGKQIKEQKQDSENCLGSRHDAGLAVWYQIETSDETWLTGLRSLLGTSSVLVLLDMRGSTCGLDSVF
jgi:hypothetical protein